MSDESSDVKIARIDERTAFMQLQSTEMVRHLEKINGAIAENQVDIATLQEARRQDRKWTYWIIVSILAVIGTIVTSFFKRIGIG